MLEAIIDNETGTLDRAHMVIDKQRQENKEQSRHSNTDEGTYLFLDVERDLEHDCPVEQIRERVYKEYEDWIIEEVIRDIGYTWLVNHWQIR